MPLPTPTSVRFNTVTVGSVFAFASSPADLYIMMTNQISTTETTTSTLVMTWMPMLGGPALHGGIITDAAAGLLDVLVYGTYNDGEIV